MNEENTVKLIEIAGPLFPPQPVDPRQNLMCFGFECGDGWFKVLEECFTALRRVREVGIAPKLTLVQVKEKFGGLRVYLAGEDETRIAWAITCTVALANSTRRPFIQTHLIPSNGFPGDTPPLLFRKLAAMLDPRRGGVNASGKREGGSRGDDGRRFDA